MRDNVDLAIVGAGAAGLVAAITAARRGASVVLLERLPRIGKKLLATGGGRCNLLNDGLSASAFTSTDPGLVSSVLDRFGAAEIRTFFEGLGLRLLSDESGRVYPVTNQAASVLKVLELEAAKIGRRDRDWLRSPDPRGPGGKADHRGRGRTEGRARRRHPGRRRQVLPGARIGRLRLQAGRRDRAPRRDPGAERRAPCSSRSRCVISSRASE